MNESSESDYNWNQELVIKPVGYVVNEFKTPSLVADAEGISPSGETDAIRQQTSLIKNTISKIIINPSLDGILEGLSDFSHALLLYWPHLMKTESRTVKKVHPMGQKKFPQVGVFASCSPARPNPILTTAVEIMSVEKNTLTVKGLEAVNNSPVIDIKPYNQHYLEVKNLKVAQWMDQIERSLS